MLQVPTREHGTCGPPQWAALGVWPLLRSLAGLIKLSAANSTSVPFSGGEIYNQDPGPRPHSFNHSRSPDFLTLTTSWLPSLHHEDLLSFLLLLLSLSLLFTASNNRCVLPNGELSLNLPAPLFALQAVFLSPIFFFGGGTGQLPIKTLIPKYFVLILLSTSPAS